MAERTRCPVCGGMLQSFECFDLPPDGCYWVPCNVPWVDWLGGIVYCRRSERRIDICEDCETVVS